MGSLIHRTLLQYIELNDLAGLKTFLDARRNAPVDDRDDVFLLLSKKKPLFIPYLSRIMQPSLS